MGWWIQHEQANLWSIWKEVSLTHLWIALALLPINLSIQAWIWQVLLQGIYPDESFADSLGAILCGASLGFFTPARIGDFAGRALYLPHHNKSELLAMAGLQQLLAFICYIGIGTLGLLYFLPFRLGFENWAWAGMALIGVLIIFGIGYLLYHPKKVYHFIKIRLPERFQSTFRFLNYLTKAQLLKLWALTALRYAVFCLQFIILLYAFPFTLTIGESLLATILMYYAKTFIPAFTFAELGIREATAVFFIGWMGGSETVGFYAATLIFIINLMIPALLGIPFVFKIAKNA